MTPPESDVLPDRTVAGRYHLREVLGRGGMGTVWLAEDLLLRREVALKELMFPSTLPEEERAELRRRSLREAQAAARISSPHAVKVFDVVEDAGRPWIVMERHHGRTLSEVIRSDGPLSPASTARVGLAVLDALEAAHAAGIVHRDVKPSNILVRDDGHVTLADFGIARSIDDTTITSTGMVVGSPSYLAPERAAGKPAVPASDLWGLGATLYAAVEGHPPFGRGDALLTLAAVLYEDPPPSRAAGPLSDVLTALLAKSPADRPSIASARFALRAVVGDPEAETRTLRLSGPVAISDRTVALSTPSPPAPPASSPAPVAPPARPPQARPPQIRAPQARPPQRSRRSRGPAVLLVLALLVGAGVVVSALRHLSPAPATGPATASGRTPAPASGAPTRSPTRKPASSSALAPTPRHTPVAASASTPPNRTTVGSTVGNRGASSRALPSGLRNYTDPAVGWSIGRPTGWQVRRHGTLTDLVEPGTGRYLRIDTTATPGPSAVGAWQAFEPAFAARHAGYSRVAMTTIAWRGFADVADWEYTYGSGGTRQHAIDRGVVTGGRAYALNFQTPDDAWTASAPLLRSLFASFTPAG